MNLNTEIQQLLASFNVPEDVAVKIAAANDDLTREGIAPGVPVGARAPDFALSDSRGKEIRLSAQLKRGPVVLSFFRGAWCPVCNLQLAAFHRALPTIKRLGGTIVAIHPDAEQLLEDPPDGFFILSDLKQAVIRSYNLQYVVSPEIQELYPGTFGVDVSTHNANGSWSLPVPGTFIVGKDGIVRRQHVRADFARRMEPTDVIEALEALQHEQVSPSSQS